jgi:dynein heavy chain 2
LNGLFLLQLEALEEELKELPLNSLMAAAFITFLCNASEDVRLEYCSIWCRMLCRDKFDFQKFLSTERDVLQWQLHGLPPDQLSHENAIMILEVKSVFPFVSLLIIISM